ncbi:hypothetical protein D3C71_1392410 [compost metagenome]
MAQGRAGAGAAQQPRTEQQQVQQQHRQRAQQQRGETGGQHRDGSLGDFRRGHRAGETGHDAVVQRQGHHQQSERATHRQRHPQRPDHAPHHVQRKQHTNNTQHRHSRFNGGRLPDRPWRSCSPPSLPKPPVPATARRSHARHTASRTRWADQRAEAGLACTVAPSSGSARASEAIACSGASGSLEVVRVNSNPERVSSGHAQT